MTSPKQRRYATIIDRLLANSHDASGFGAWAKVNGKEQWVACRFWDGPVVKSKRSHNFYPRFNARLKGLGHTTLRAHRVMFEEFWKVKLGEHQCNHICGNTLCINPYHLEKVTHRQNMRDRDERRRMANGR